MDSRETQPQGNIEILTQEGLRASINPQGAFLEFLVDPYGRDLLFPRQNIDGKDRGGIPICAPVFGPGAAVGLSQHGFARNLRWSFDLSNTNPNAVSLVLASPIGQDPQLAGSDYEHCDMSVAIEMDSSNPDESNRLRLALAVENSGETGFVLTPGFHPYFPLAKAPNEIDISNGGQDSHLTLAELSVAQVLQKSEEGLITFNNGTHDIKVLASGLLVPVIWTASPDEYVCVEPTAAGAVTGDPKQPVDESFVLNPGEVRSYSMEIIWQSTE